MTEEKKCDEIKVMPLLPLRGISIFPGMLLHFDVGRPKSISALENAMRRDQMLFLVAQRDIKSENPELADVYKVGTICRIHQILKLPGDSVRVMVEGMSRATIIGASRTEPYIEANIVEACETLSRSSEVRIEALLRKAKEIFKEYVEAGTNISVDIVNTIMTTDIPGTLADLIIHNTQVRVADKQVILEEFDQLKRLSKVIGLLSKEISIIKMELGIQDKICQQLDKNQRDYYLREQIRAIQEELGEGDDVFADSDEYKEKIYALNLNEECTDKLIKEATRLTKVQYSSPEGGVIRAYLDTCLELPWNKTTKEQKNMEKAEKILNDEHFGMEKVKERVLEFLAVRGLSKGASSQIICLIGPPGTGKTSIASSIAHASGRNFVRLSLGGVRDEADIRGHRKTYVGAMPGRIMTSIKQAGSKNCVMLLDEIDKMGHDMSRGDPAAALLEVLDSGQNTAFRDHYIELPFDLSQVLFITTANSYDTIPRPLLDRMEIIDIEGYTDEEKLHIAKEHLLPKQIAKHGLKKSMISVTDDGIRKIIEDYTREAGVRTLERLLASICRKTAKKIMDGNTKKVSVTDKNLSEFLGNARYKRERLELTNKVGVVNGLAWTSVGGEILEVEAGVVDGVGRLELTGNLGEVMKESARAALTYIRGRAELLGVDTNFYKTKDMHIHFPEGATPKDGPSAGITTATALISALTGRKVRGDVAMTGEITLTGRVLAIGGLKEKTMAAYRAGIKKVIIPKDNVSDLDDIDRTVRAGIEFIPASHMDEVIKEALEPVECSTEQKTCNIPFKSSQNSQLPAYK